MVLPLAILATGSLPAGGAEGGKSDEPPAKISAAHDALAEIVAARAKGLAVGEDEDEGDEVMARFEWMNSVLSAPALSVSADGLWAGTKAANALPVAPGRWSELTDLPFLNDPINRGQNYGVGWGHVTGRMTALTASGSTVYAGAADGGVWRSGDRVGTGPRSTTGFRVSLLVPSRPTLGTGPCGSGLARRTQTSMPRRRSESTASPAAHHTGSELAVGKR